MTTYQTLQMSLFTNPYRT